MNTPIKPTIVGIAVVTVRLLFGLSGFPFGLFAATPPPTPPIPVATQSYQIELLNYSFTLSSTSPGTDGDPIGGAPSLAFDGTNFLVVWRNAALNPQPVYGTFVSHDGMVLSSPGDISIGFGPNSSSSNWYPSVAFDGTNYLVVWVSEVTPGGHTAIYAARVKPDGTILDTPPVEIARPPDDAKLKPISLAFDGTNYLVVWRTGNDAIRGARITKSLVNLDGTAGFGIGGGFYPWVAFNGTNYLVVWHAHGANGLVILGAIVDKNGTVLPPGVIAISPDGNDQDHASVASDGTNFLVAWHNWDGLVGANFDVYQNGSANAARVTAAGAVLDSPPLKISNHTLSEAPVQTVYDGANYVVAWHVDGRENYRLSDVFGRRVSIAGVLLEQEPFPVTTSVGHSFGPVMGSGADRLLVAWNSTGTGGQATSIRAQMLAKVVTPSAVPALPAASPLNQSNLSDAGWSSEPSPGYLLHNILAFDESHVYVSTDADDGTVLSYDGNAWSVGIKMPPSRKFGLWGMGPLDLWGIGGGFNIKHYNGFTVADAFVFEPNGTGEGIWGSSTANIWAVGAIDSLPIQGAFYHYDGTDWTKEAPAVPVDVWDIWGTASNNIYAVGEFGTVVKYDGLQWIKEASIPTNQSLNAIWGIGANDVFAVGDSGSIIHFDGTSWSSQGSGTTENLYGVWGFSGSSVYAVGDYGTIVHYDGANWTAQNSGTTVTLSDVSGAGNTVRAVGDNGVILRKTEKDCVGATAPSTASFLGNGGVGNLVVTASGSCSWSAVANNSWIGVTSGSSGIGDGTVSFSVAPNAESGSRSGSLTIAGQTFAVSQSAAPTPTPTPTATPAATATAAPTATATVTPTATATPSASATATPVATPTPGTVGNVSTRLPVGTGDNALIEGFIVQGADGSTKQILVRAIGPSLTLFGITDALANPTLEIHNNSGATIAANDDWKNTQIGGLITGGQLAEISASGLAPSNDLESAIIANLAPGNYTAVVRGAKNSTGTGVVDAYDISASSPARLANIATRGLIQPGDQLMIAGFIVQNAPVKAVIRAIGPSLKTFGINNALADTTLQLRDQNGAIVRENDDWQTDQKLDLESTSLQPSDPLEAAVVATLPPGPYTAQVRGKPETTGIGVVQVYFLSN